jgi:hypothetical protein
VLNRRAGAAVAFLVVASAVARVRASEDVQLGWIAPDEMVYALLGRSLWETGSPSLLGEGGGFYSLVYPALVGPLLARGDLASMARPLQLVQALVMSAAAVVVYLWGRPLLGAGWAVLAAALTLALPGLAYSGLLMKEVVLYPLSAAALWAIARALERPTAARQALAAGGIAAGVLTHPQMVALLPALVLAVALQCAITRDLLPALRQLPLVAGLAGAGSALVVASAAVGHATNIFGVYEPAVTRYDLGAAATDVLWHWAAAYVVVAGIPLVALALLVVRCFAGDERDPRAVALVCTASAWTVCLVLEVGVFASHWVGHLAERDLLSLAPPLFLAFGLWLASGLPRPRAWTPLLALALATPAILLPVRRFAVQEAALDSFSFIPLWRLAEATSLGLLELTFSAAAAALAAAATIVPRRGRPVLPALVGGVLLTLAVTSSRELVRLSDGDQWWVLDRAHPGWIDDAANGRVTYLHTSVTAAAAYKHVLWNHRIAEVVRLPEASGVQPLEADVVSPRFDGLLLRRDGSRLGARMLVLPTDMIPVGERLAATGRVTNLPGLALWRLQPPARLKLRMRGFHVNGDLLGNEAEVTVFGCEPGRLEVTLLGKQGTPVDVSVNGVPRVRRAVPGGVAETISVPGPVDADGRAPCVFRFSSPGLTGSTRIEYVSQG